MVSAEEIVNVILKQVKKKGSTGIHYGDVAREINPVEWEMMLEQVKLVAETLAQEERIALRREGNDIYILAPEQS